MGKEKKEELQSRRDFFKKAAKGVLPILGALAVSQLPVIAKASEGEACTCGNLCYYTCRGGCDGKCYNGCLGCRGCSETCQGTCKGSCEGSCRGSCTGSCDGGCYGLNY